MNYNLILTIFSILLCSNISAQNVTNLRCEHLANPIGMDSDSPRFTWQLEDHRQGAFQQSYRILVGEDSVEVSNGVGKIWDTKCTVSDKMLVPYAGLPLQPFKRYFWRVEISDMKSKPCASPVAWFETGMKEVKNWRGMWISDGYEGGGNNMYEKAAPYFRKQFVTSKPIRSARAYIAVGGLYELSINGKRIGDHRLDPMYTRFDRRNLYVTYDITQQLSEGENAVGVLLGNGWYNYQPTSTWFFDRAPWRNRPTFCMDIRIEYEDGSQEIVSTDKSWKTSLSPVIFNSIYTAEHYDARLEQNGWDKPMFNDLSWKASLLRSAPSQNIVSQQLHPIRNVERIKVKTIKKIDEATYQIDFGRNISGVTQLSVQGEQGTEIRVKHSEMLGKDGRLEMRNIGRHYRPYQPTDSSNTFQTDIYILDGKGVETFMPKFNYKGFQYVEITTNKPMTITSDDIIAWFMHSDVPQLGNVTTSNPMINKLWQATNSSYLSNLFGYPTDCPHREKNGWTGDAHIVIETALYNFDGITIYEKWLADHQDEQQPNGTLPAIIPTGGWGYHWANGLDWTSTIAIIPWNIYLFYGDSRLLSDCYDNIKLYVDNVTNMYPMGLTDWGLGDWIPVKSKTPIEFTSSVYYYVDAVILSETAKLFNKQSDYEKYSALAKKIKDAINKKYLNREKGIYGTGLQTELSVPLQWNIVPEDMKEKVAANLAARVKADNNHIDVGLLGSKAILNALSENGYADLAYSLVAQETYPSWGWWIVNGATTLYENWSVDDTSMSLRSLNHIMFGEISAWLYKALGGIKPDPASPGFKQILLKPLFVAQLNYANTSYVSPYGEIISKWERKGKKIAYTVVIPANSSAQLTIPKEYKLKKITTLSDNKKFTAKQIGEDYILPAGSYTLEIN